MHEKGTYVFYGSGGICRISDLQVAPLAGMPAGQLYYVLKPVYDTGEVMYVPVENERVYLRPVMDAAAAEALISSLEQILPIEADDSKQLRASYAECMSSHLPASWVRVIKTVQLRRSSCKKNMRLSETERIYYENARRYLGTELSLALGCSERDLWERIADRLE